jgi:hypothetical protein
MTLFKKYLFLSLFIAFLNLLVILFFFVPRLQATDSAQYISTILHLSGDHSATLVPYRLIKPLPILIGIILLPLMTAGSALIFQNIIFYFASVLLIFLLVNLVYKNEKQAFYGAVLFSTAYPVLAYGLSPLTDFGGWFFYILCIYLTIKFFNNPSIKKSLFIGFLGGIGMLFKENLAALVIFFPFFLFICTPLPVKNKLKYIFSFLSAFLVPVVVSQAIIYYFISYSMIQWYFGFMFDHGNSSAYIYSIPRIIIEIARVFSFGWIFFLVGLLKEMSIKDKNRSKILIALVPSSLSFFLWAAPHNRIAFISAPLIIMLGSFGLVGIFQKQKISKYAEPALLFFCIFINYFLVEFFLKYGNILRPMF